MTATYYFDSSALVKRYVTEAGTGWIRSLIAPAGGSLSLISRLTIVEVRSALARRKRERAISSDEHVFALGALRTHSLTQYRLIEFDASVANLAGDLLEHHSLRAYDAVQLASALIVACALTGTGMAAPTFLTADDRLSTLPAPKDCPPITPTGIHSEFRQAGVQRDNSASSTH
jgi:predicted nucleic acid-binding protein